MPRHDCRPTRLDNPSSVGNNLRFRSEDLSIKLMPPVAQVRADYEFDYTGSGPFSMTFPLPDCAELLLDSLMFTEPVGFREGIPVRRSLGSWTWTVPDRGAGRYTLTLRYRQTMPDGLFHYILSTSKLWPQPIGHVKINVSTPAEGFLWSSHYLNGIRYADFASSRDLLLFWEPSLGKGSLEGKVVDANCTPLPFATVEVHSPGARQVLTREGRKSVITHEGARRVMTREDGVFFIEDIEAGPNALRADLIGFSRASGNVPVFQGRTTDLEVMLFADPNVPGSGETMR